MSKTKNNQKKQSYLLVCLTTTDTAECIELSSVKAEPIPGLILCNDYEQMISDVFSGHDPFWDTCFTGVLNPNTIYLYLGSCVFLNIQQFGLENCFSNTSLLDLLTY